MDKEALERELEEAKDDLENNLSEQQELRSIERSLRNHIIAVETLLENTKKD